jgi:thioredoxin reductase/ferredoxin
VTFLVPAVLGGLAILIIAGVSMGASRRRSKAARTQPAQQRILIHAINDDRCTGCDACVAVCPTNVLDLVDNKSRVLRFQDCIQCEACMWACPTSALVMHTEGTEPPSLELPALDEFYQTEIPGQYLIGEVAGKPLVKNAANLGRGVVEHILQSGIRPGALARKRAEGSDAQQVTCVDVAIVGSGPGGLSAALSCIQRGLSYVLLEKDQMIASTIAHYPKGKLIMAEPYDVPNHSLLPVFDSSKEQILPLWEELADRVGMQVNLGEAVEKVSKEASGTFDVRTNVSSYRAQRVILATGTRGKPRTLGVPGENLPKINSLLDDPDDYRGLPVLVVGGGDSALEAALALADAGAKVVLSYRGRAFNRAQPKLRKQVESYASQRRIKVKFNSVVKEFDDKTVTLAMTDGSLKRYPNAAAFVLIGSVPPVKWLNKLGINFVKRPHSYALPQSQSLVARLVRDVIPCPEDLERAAAQVLGQPVAAMAPAQPDRAPTHLPEAVSGPRKWLRSATSIFTSARKLDKPMPLSEFAKRSNRRQHTGHGRRDDLSPRERTRVLRMLRDEGGRLADEDSQVYLIAGNDSVVEASPPPEPMPRPIPRMPLAPEDSAPRQAVIVGLARAMANGPAAGASRTNGNGNGHKRRTAGPRRRVPSSSPPPIPSQRRRPRPPSPQFVDAATVQIDTSSALDQLLRKSARPSRPEPEFGDEATRAVDLDAPAFMNRFDNLDDDVIVSQPSGGAIEVDSGVFLIDEHDESTRAVDVSDIARLDSIHGIYEEPTRAVDVSRAASLSDVEWDLD